jgi:hypothetical protein
MAPQFTAMYGPCFRALKAWMIWGITSLPVPLSPVINTLRSVGATCAAISMALSRPAEVPMMPKRCLMG